MYAKGGTSQFSGGKGNVVKMNVYQEISQIIKEADGILIGASNGLSIAEGYNIFADDAWFQENMGDFIFITFPFLLCFLLNPAGFLPNLLLYKCLCLLYALELRISSDSDRHKTLFILLDFYFFTC